MDGKDLYVNNFFFGNGRYSDLKIFFSCKAESSGQACTIELISQLNKIIISQVIDA